MFGIALQPLCMLEAAKDSRSNMNADHDLFDRMLEVWNERNFELVLDR